MTRPPLPQQTIITDFIVRHREAAVFACPGLGKSRATIDAIKFLIADGAIKGALIVAPLRVCTLTWPNEIDMWGGLAYANLRTEEGMQAWKDGSADVYLANYEMLATRTVTRKCSTCKGRGCRACQEGQITTVYKNVIAKCLQQKRPLPADMVVWDESSKTRGHNNKAMKEFMGCRSRFSHHVGLTGTPQANSCADLWGQFRMLDGGVRLGPSFHAFQNRYGSKDYMGYSWIPDPDADQIIRGKVADITLVMRGEDWLDIPPVTFEDIDVVLPPLVMKGYRRLQRDMLIEIEKKEVVALSAGVLVNKLAQYASGMSYYIEGDETKGTVYIHDEKVKALAALHKKIGFKPLLVFIQYRHEIERILKALPQAREFDIDKVSEWNRGEIPMWVVHPKSAAHGLSLQGTCCNVCWFSLGYSYEDFKQGCARVARTGQTQPTTIYRLLAQDTIDWAQLEVIQGKAEGEAGLKSVLKFVKVLDKAPAAA